MKLPKLFALALGGAVLVAASCSQLPSRIEMPDLDPEAAAARAIGQYDADGDGRLSQPEYSQSPALSAAYRQFDADQDGTIGESEIARRLQSWLDSKQALLILPVQVNWRGEGLADATVRFVPEEFLGDAFRPAESVTDHYGVANMMHAPEDRPDPTFPQGVRVGLYRVEISKEVDGKELIPAKYNTQTTLGQEVAAGAAGMGQGLVTFSLMP